MKTVYISGKITGLTEEQYKIKFAGAEKLLRQYGYRPVNPAKKGEVPGYKWEDYLKEDIAMLCECDFIYFLDNWNESEGAKLEKFIAEKLKIPTLEILK